MDKTYNLILPFCLYSNRNDKYLSKISIENDSCTTTNSDWYFQDKLYFIDDDIAFHYVPDGMTVYLIYINEQFPYNITNITIPTNPFVDIGNTIGIITFSHKKPLTVPLYLYQTNTGIFVSYEKHKELNELHISPLFVLTRPDVRFKCIHNHCIPTLDKDAKDLYSCILSCKDTDTHKKEFMDLLTKQQSTKKKKNLTFFLITLGLICILFFYIFL